LGRRGWAFSIIGVLFVALIVIVFVRANDFGGGSSANPKWEENIVDDGSGEDKIVQLFVDGTIAQHASFTSGFDAGTFISQLDQVIEDDRVKAVVIRVNSPGGEVVASDEIHNKIVEVQQSGKSVIVSMGAIAASGGYYISAPADRIFANPSTLTGSLGVIFSLPNYQEIADKIGYKETHIKSGKFKDIGSPMRELTDEEKDIFQQLVSESYMQFVDVISKGRDLSKEQVIKIADGRIYSGRQAKELGLIDQFGSLDDATDYALKELGLEGAQIIRYSEPFSFASLLGIASQQSKSSTAEILQEFLPKVTMEPRLLYIYQP
jgi:protease-4